MYHRWLTDGRSFNLGRMSLRDLWIAYLTHPAVHLYIALSVVCCGLAVHLHPSWTEAAIAAGVTVLAYPLAWYLIHRFILHARFLYRSPLTAALWKRIHFDHHQDPNRMDVLFGAPATTLPTIIGILLPIGAAIGGAGGAAVAVATGLVTTCIYEFCHCVQHLNFKPRSALLRRMKELHLAHHFHDERSNYGITSFAFDHLLGTYRPSPKGTPRSAHVFDLGYDLAESVRYPWVARLTGAPPRSGPPIRVRRAGTPAAPRSP